MTARRHDDDEVKSAERVQVLIGDGSANRRRRESRTGIDRYEFVVAPCCRTARVGAERHGPCTCGGVEGTCHFLYFFCIVHMPKHRLGRTSRHLENHVAVGHRTEHQVTTRQGQSADVRGTDVVEVSADARHAIVQQIDRTTFAGRSIKRQGVRTQLAIFKVAQRAEGQRGHFFAIDTHVER